MRKYGLFLIAFTCMLFAASYIAWPVFSQSTSEKETASASATPIIPKEAPATGINLTLSPVFINLTTDPGISVSSAIRVTNNNNFREYLEIQVAKFTANYAGEAPIIVDLTPEDEFGKWVTFSEKQFVVEPNETKSVKFTVAPPKDSSLGYYYALMISRINESGEKSATLLKGSPAIPVLLEVRTPNAKRELQLVDFSTDKLIYEYLPVTFKVKLKNTGNIHVVPSGDIFVDWGKDRDVGLVHANATRGNILPKTERTYTSEWNDGFIVRMPKMNGNTVVRDDKGNMVYETKWDLSKADKIRIGKYTAHVLMVYDNGQRDIPLEATISFWVIPWKIIGILLLIIFFVLVGVKNTIFGAFRKKK